MHPLQAVTCFCPTGTGMGSSDPVTLKGISRKWMAGNEEVLCAHVKKKIIEFVYISYPIIGNKYLTV